MRRARPSALLRYALAAALAAITIPFLAHAAFGDETATDTTTVAPTAPVVTPFPILTGQGLKWWTVLNASWLEVERRLPGDSWQDVSGQIAGTATTWADRTLPVGGTAEYRVTAGNADGTSPPSNVVTATRQPDVGTGTVNALSVDTDGTADQVATSFDESSADAGYRTLRSTGPAGSPTLSVTLPALPGPGVYEIGPEAAYQVSIRSSLGCSIDGKLRVDQLAYSDDYWPTATMAATADGVCRTAEGGGSRVVLELRVHSARPLLAVTASPVDAGRVVVGQASEAKAVTVRNTGSAQVELGTPTVVGTTAGDWTIQANHCPAALAAGASCTVDLVVQPSGSGTHTAQLELPDNTVRGKHHAALTVTGVGTAAAPANFKAVGTLTGVDLSWDLPTDTGETEVTGYTVHRLAAGTTTTFEVARAANGTTSRWTDSNPPAGATYAVSARNQIGDGTPTAAQAPRQTSDVLAYSNGGLYQWSWPDGTQPVPVGSGTPAQDVGEMAASSDGRYLAYAADGALWTVRADSPAVSAPVRVASVGTVWEIAWSPDRSRLAYSQAENWEDFCVWVVTLPSGNPVKVRCGVRQPSWLPDLQSLVVADTHGGALQRVAANATGAVLGTYADTAGATTPAVSPDGRWIAYGSSPFAPKVGLIPLTGGVAQSTSLSYLPGKLYWSPAADRLLTWAHTDVHGLLTVAADGKLGPEASLFPQYVEGIRAPVWQGLNVHIPPTPAVTGSAVSVPFDLSALSPGTSTVCRLDAGAWAPCTTPYRATGVSSGVHTFAAKATEPSGRTVVASRAFTADATGPVARVTGPNYQSSVAPSAVVTLAATDLAGVASYDVRYRRATSAGAYSAYVQPWTGITATSVDVAVAAGYEYCFSVRAKDKLGNVGDWSADRCFSRPIDDRSLVMATTGWARGSSTKFYFGTDTQTTASGAALTRTVQGKRFFLIATRCPTCGSVAVYAGSRLLTTLNLAYPTTHYQVVLGLPVQSTVFSGTLTLRTVSTGKIVQIDGLAVGRT